MGLIVILGAVACRFSSLSRTFFGRAKFGDGLRGRGREPDVLSSVVGASGHGVVLLPGRACSCLVWVCVDLAVVLVPPWWDRGLADFLVFLSLHFRGMVLFFESFWFLILILFVSHLSRGFFNSYFVTRGIG